MSGDDGPVPRRWAGTLALGPWWLFFDGAFGPTEAHRHHAVQIVAADAPVVVESVSFDRVEGRLVVIPTDTIHAIVSGPPSATVLFLDADSHAGRRFGVDGSLRSLDASSLPQRAGVARVFADAEPARHLGARCCGLGAERSLIPAEYHHCEGARPARRRRWHDGYDRCPRGWTFAGPVQPSIHCGGWHSVPVLSAVDAPARRRGVARHLRDTD